MYFRTWFNQSIEHINHAMIPAVLGHLHPPVHVVRSIYQRMYFLQLCQRLNRPSFFTSYFCFCVPDGWASFAGGPSIAVRFASVMRERGGVAANAW